MPESIHRTYPNAKHQLCLVHETRTICRDVRKRDRKVISNEFKDVYTSKNKEKAETMLSAFESKWQKTYPNMVRKLKKQENLFTFMDYSEPLWKTIYTSNTIESFNAKLKRILMNSESNAIITITSCCADYNKNAGKVTLRHFSEITDKEKNNLFQK